MNNNFKKTITRLMLLLSVLKLGMPGQTGAEAWNCAEISTSDKSARPPFGKSGPERV